MEQFRASRFKGVGSLMSGGVLRCNMRSTQKCATAVVPYSYKLELRFLINIIVYIYLEYHTRHNKSGHFDAHKPQTVAIVVVIQGQRTCSKIDEKDVTQRGNPSTSFPKVVAGLHVGASLVFRQTIPA